MREENDWRLQNQAKYLSGVELRWEKYVKFSEEWEHEHCQFCWAKFMDVDDPEVLREGYVDESGDRWICEECFEDFRDLFGWRVVRSK